MKLLLKLSIFGFLMSFVSAYAEDKSFCDEYTQFTDEKQGVFSCSFCTKFSVSEFEEATKGKGLEEDLDGYGLTQLMCASYNADLTMAEKLIKAGAKVNARNNSGKTPLMLAARANSNPEMIKLLVKNGAEVNAISGGKYQKDKCNCYEYDMSAIEWAIVSPNPNPKGIVSALIEAKADLNHNPTELGYASPLAATIYFEQSLDLLEILLKAGAKPTEDALEIAKYRKNLKALELLEKATK